MNNNNSIMMAPIKQVMAIITRDTWDLRIIKIKDIISHRDLNIMRKDIETVDLKRKKKLVDSNLSSNVPSTRRESTTMRVSWQTRILLNQKKKIGDN